MVAIGQLSNHLSTPTKNKCNREKREKNSIGIYLIWVGLVWFVFFICHVSQKLWCPRASSTSCHLHSKADPARNTDMNYLRGECDAWKTASVCVSNLAQLFEFPPLYSMFHGADFLRFTFAYFSSFGFSHFFFLVLLFWRQSYSTTQCQNHIFMNWVAFHKKSNGPLCTHTHFSSATRPS